MGAGAVLGSGLWAPGVAVADDDHDDSKKKCGVPLPIPFNRPGPFGPVHQYFPGPIDGSAWPTDPTGTHAEGRDPSTITNFDGFVGEVDLNFKGTARDTRTGAQVPLFEFHTDSRFIIGDFIASDQKRHKGAFAFL
jgi:hypothetical protein